MAKRVWGLPAAAAGALLPPAWVRASEVAWLAAQRGVPGGLWDESDRPALLHMQQGREVAWGRAISHGPSWWLPAGWACIHKWATSYSLRLAASNSRWLVLLAHLPCSTAQAVCSEKRA